MYAQIGGTLIYMSVMLHAMDKYPLGLIALAVGLQHLIAGVKYVSPISYAILLAALEIWFQCEAYYVLTFATTAVQIGVWGLLSAHYVWLLHSCVELAFEHSKEYMAKKHSNALAAHDLSFRHNDKRTAEIAQRPGQSSTKNRAKGSMFLYRQISALKDTGRDSILASRNDYGGPIIGGVFKKQAANSNGSSMGNETAPGSVQAPLPPLRVHPIPPKSLQGNLESTVIEDMSPQSQAAE